jgi:hypothetical protein
VGHFEVILDSPGLIVQKTSDPERLKSGILVIGSRDEFSRVGNPSAANVMRDTFELLRRETRSIDIVTFDELLERARFIT